MTDLTTTTGAGALARRAPIFALAATLLLPSLGLAQVVLHNAETRLTSDALDRYDAAVDDGVITYTVQDYDDKNVLGFDAVGTPWSIGIGDGDQYLSDVSGWQVVYVDNFGGDDDVMWLFDFRSGEANIIVSAPNRQSLPVISGDTLMWVTNENGSEDVYWMVKGGTETPLANEPWAESEPALDGVFAAWVSVIPGSNGDIHAAVLGQTPFAVTSGPEPEYAPDVSGNLIAYIVSDDVAVYDHSDGSTTRLTTDAWIQKNVQIDGDNVLWVDNRNGNDDIFLMDINDQQLFQLTSDTANQVLTDVDNGVAVFHDDRDGDLDVFRLDFALNHLPLAAAGSDQNIPPGAEAMLEGSACDDDHDPECGIGFAGWEWVVTDAPAGAVYDLFDFDTPFALLFTDPVAEGDYVITLRAFDGLDWGPVDTMVVSTATPPDLPQLILVMAPDPPEGPAPLVVTFDMSQSLYSETFSIDFGDGSPLFFGPDTSVPHTYDAAGLFWASVQAHNQDGSSAPVVRWVNVLAATGACCFPDNGSCTDAMDEATCLSAGGIYQGGGVPCSAVSCLHPADLDGSGAVGFSDLTLLLAAWGPCPPGPCPADLDGTGDVGFSDLTTLLANWDA